MQVDKDSSGRDAYIKAYIDADPDVQRETGTVRNIEARIAAGACAVISDMARTGELEESLAEEVIAEWEAMKVDGLQVGFDPEPAPEGTPEEQRLWAESERQNRRYLIEVGFLEYDPVEDADLNLDIRPGSAPAT